MTKRDGVAPRVRVTTEMMTTGCKLPYAALVVSSVVLGFELFR